MTCVTVMWGTEEILFPRSFLRSPESMQLYIEKHTGIPKERQLLLRHPDDEKPIELSEFASLSLKDPIYVKDAGEARKTEPSDCAACAKAAGSKLDDPHECRQTEELWEAVSTMLEALLKDKYNYVSENLNAALTAKKADEASSQNCPKTDETAETKSEEKNNPEDQSADRSTKTSINITSFQPVSAPNSVQSDQAETKIETKTDGADAQPQAGDLGLERRVEMLEKSMAKVERELREFDEDEEEYAETHRPDYYDKCWFMVTQLMNYLLMLLVGVLIGVAMCKLFPSQKSSFESAKDHLDTCATLITDVKMFEKNFLGAIDTHYTLRGNSSEADTTFGLANKDEGMCHSHKMGDEKSEQFSDITDDTPWNSTDDIGQLKKAIFVTLKDRVKAEAFWGLLTLIEDFKEKSGNQILVN